MAILTIKTTFWAPARPVWFYPHETLQRIVQQKSYLVAWTFVKINNNNKNFIGNKRWTSLKYMYCYFNQCVPTWLFYLFRCRKWSNEPSLPPPRILSSPAAAAEKWSGYSSGVWEETFTHRHGMGTNKLWIRSMAMV